MHKENVKLCGFFFSVPEHKEKLAYKLPLVTRVKQLMSEVFFFQAAVRDEEIPYGPLVQRKQRVTGKKKKETVCVRVTEGNKIERTKHQHC